MKILLLLFELVTLLRTGTSLQCYQGNATNKELTDCSLKSSFLVMGLECLVKEPRGEIVDLAQQYLTPLKKCLDSFESCIYLELTDFFTCTCDLPYVAYFKPLNMKTRECKNVSQSDHEQLIKPYLLQHGENYLKLFNASAQCSNLFSKRKTQASGKLDLPIETIESRRNENYKVCTCDSNECDPTKLGPEKTSTVGPGSTIIPGSSTKKNGSNGQDVIPGSSTKKDGSNGQDGSNEDKKSTTTESSAMVHLFEQSLVIMMIMAITISFIFNNFL